jgi:hypothetical protein
MKFVRLLTCFFECQFAFPKFTSIRSVPAETSEQVVRIKSWPGPLLGEGTSATEEIPVESD